jgi:TRAP-type C4-dicarboxylate transport system substrate-binding protein
VKKYTRVAFVLFTLILVIPTAFAACTQQPPAPGQVIQLKWGALAADTHFRSVIQKEWMAKIEKETNGKVKFTQYWGGTMITPADHFDQMANGVVDVINASADYPKTGFEIHKNSGQFYYGVTTCEAQSKVFNELRKKFPEIDGQYAKYGKLLANGEVVGFQQLITKKPVRTMTDLKGMQIKATPAWANVINGYNAEAVMTSMFDLYLALQKGTVDGLCGPRETLISFKFDEVTKYVTNINFTYALNPGIVISNNAWAKLPQDVQKVMMNNVQWYSDEIIKATNKIEADSVTYSKTKGMETINLSKEEIAKLDQLIYADAQKKAADLDAKGFPGSKILTEARKLIQQYK